jgi:hypothetical protein
MTAAKYNALRQAILNHLLGIADFVKPTSVKVRLFTVAPTAAGGGTPVAGNGYTDVTIPWDGSVVPAATGLGVGTQATAIHFGFADGGAWGTIVAVDFRRASNNELLWFATLDAPVTVADGEGFGFNAGDLVWRET